MCPVYKEAIRSSRHSATQRCNDLSDFPTTLETCSTGIPTCSINSPIARFRIDGYTAFT